MCNGVNDHTIDHNKILALNETNMQINMISTWHFHQKEFVFQSCEMTNKQHHFYFNRVHRVLLVSVKIFSLLSSAGSRYLPTTPQPKLYCFIHFIVNRHHEMFRWITNPDIMLLLRQNDSLLFSSFVSCLMMI